MYNPANYNSTEVCRIQDVLCNATKIIKIPGLRSHQNLNVMFYVTILTNQQSMGGRRKFYRWGKPFHLHLSSSIITFYSILPLMYAIHTLEVKIFYGRLTDV